MGGKGRADEGLKGSALEERINWVMNRLGKAGEHAAPGNRIGREYELEILSYGEDAVIPLMKNLQYIANHEKAAELLEKIEQEHAGVLKRYVKTLAELAKQYKVCGDEWSENGVLKLLPLIEAKLEPDDFKRKTLLTDIHLSLFGFEESQLRAEYEKADAAEKKELPSYMRDQAVSRLFAVISKSGGNRIEKQVAKKTLVLMGPTVMPHILVNLEHEFGVLGLNVLHQLEASNPGRIALFKGIPSVVHWLKWDGSVDAAKLLELVGVPALEEILKVDEPGFGHATAVALIMRKEPQAAVSELKRILATDMLAPRKLHDCIAHRMMADERMIEPLSLMLRIREEDSAFNLVGDKTAKGLRLAQVKLVIEVSAAVLAGLDSNKIIPVMKQVLDEGPVEARYFAALGLYRRGEGNMLVGKLFDETVDKAVRNDILHAITAETLLTKDEGLRADEMRILQRMPTEAAKFIFWEAGTTSSQLDVDGLRRLKESAARALVELGPEPLERLRLGSTEPAERVVSVMALRLLISKANGLEGFRKEVGAEKADSLLARLVEIVESKEGAMGGPGRSVPTNFDWSLPQDAGEAGKLLAELGVPAIPIILARMQSNKFNQKASDMVAIIATSIIEKNPGALDIPGTMPTLVRLLQGGKEQSAAATAMIAQIGEPALPLLIAELETAYNGPIPEELFNRVKGETAKIAKTDSDVRDLARSVLAERYDIIANALASLISENKLQNHPVLTAQLPEYLSRVEEVNAKNGFMNGSARMIFATGGPAVGMVAEKLKAWNEDSVRISEGLHQNMYGGSSGAGKVRSRYLQVMAHAYLSNPSDEIAKGFIPDFAGHIAASSFDAQAERLRLGLPLHDVVVPWLSNQFIRVTDVFIDATAAAGENGIDALLQLSERADARGRRNIANALLEIKTQKPEMLPMILGKIVPMADSIVDLSFVLKPAVGPKAEAIKEAACAIGLYAVEPICAAFGRGMPDWLEKFWMGILSDIADKNKGAPGLAPMIPLFSAKLEMPTLVNIGPAAVPFLLKEFEKDPRKAEAVGKIIDVISTLTKEVDRGIVAKPKKPEDMQRLLANRALDVGVQGKPVMVKS